MFKVVKLRALIVMMVLLFLNETTHAMFRMSNGTEPVPKEYQSKQQQQYKRTSLFSATPIPKNVFEQAEKIKKEYIVKKLDKHAKEWDYTDFNWVETYPYFSTHINSVDFIEATSSGYESIEYLARVLLNSDEFNSKTIYEARFLVYSVLNAIHNDRITNKKTRLHGFPFLQKVHKIVQPYKPEEVTVNPIPSKNDDASYLLFIFFTSRPDITNFRLTNSLSDLLKIINQRADIIYLQSEWQPSFKIPTVREVLSYYPAEQYEVFSFLMNYPLEFEPIVTPFCIKYIPPEKNLKQEISKLFIQLWKEESKDNLAQLAINVFGFNPLNPAISQAGASYAVQQPPKSSSVDWEAIKLKCGTDFATMVVRNHYFPLMYYLNIDPLMPHLLQKKVITPCGQQELSTPPVLENMEQNTDYLNLLDDLTGYCNQQELSILALENMDQNTDYLNLLDDLTGYCNQQELSILALENMVQNTDYLNLLDDLTGYCNEQKLSILPVLENMDQNTGFLNTIIADSRNSFQPLKNLLEIMEIHGSPDEQALAGRICFGLQSD